jgi:CheY-like chemotaxis protein
VKKILVLDDNQDILDIVEAVLKYENYEVTSISEGDELISNAENIDPDLILLDYRLAGQNGDELCRQIKSHPDLKKVPVVIFSAYLFNDADLKKLSCDAVIAKPFDINELVDKLNSLLPAD